MLEKLARQPDFTVLLVQLSGARTAIGALVFDPVAYIKLGRDAELWTPTDLKGFAVLLARWEQLTSQVHGRFDYVDWKPLPEFRR
jgi:hypothetical protein